MDSITLLPASAGFDLDGSGTPNNELAILFEDDTIGPALGSNPNEYIARRVRRGKLLLLLDFSRLNDFVDDDSLDLDLYLGRDGDGERRDNFEGDDFQVSCSSLTEVGGAESRFFNLSLEAGQLRGEEGQFRLPISFAGNREVVLQKAKIEVRFSDRDPARGRHPRQDGELPRPRGRRLQ